MNREPVVIINAIAAAIIAGVAALDVSWSGAVEGVVVAIVAVAATWLSRSKVTPV